MTQPTHGIHGPYKPSIKLKIEQHISHTYIENQNIQENVSTKIVSGKNSVIDQRGVDFESIKRSGNTDAEDLKSRFAV